MRRRGETTDRNGQARRALGYVLSLPERGLRSTSALAGGLVQELTEVALPGSFRRTKLYQSLVNTTLRFVIEQVGKVQQEGTEGSKLAADFALRRTAGNGIEMVGLLLFRLSPVWVLAALSDLSGTTRVLVREISETLQENGLLEANRQFRSIDQILDGLEATSGHLADTINTPPFDIPTLRQEWETLRKEAGRIPVRSLPNPDRLFAAWGELKQEAARQRCSIFEISSLMALSAVAHLPRRTLWLTQCATLAATKTGTLLATNLLDHYSSTLKEIHQIGYIPYWAKEFRPYVQAAAEHFSPVQSTYTEKFFRWCLSKINTTAFATKKQ